MGSSEVVAKRRSTCLEVYGVDNVSKAPSVLRKIKRHVRKWYDDPKFKARLIAKTKATCMKRYGVAFPMQHADVFYRSNTRRYRRKSITIGGRRYGGLQGFEPFALRWLIEKHDARILNKADLSFNYRFRDQTRVYFPDIVARVNGKRVVVEVKSTYTAGLTSGAGWQERFEQLCAKARSVGPCFLLIVVSKSGRVLAAKRGVPSRTRLRAIIDRSLARVS